MKVRELIEKLRTFDPELPVCLQDWFEQYSSPAECTIAIDSGEDCHLYDPSKNEYTKQKLSLFVLLDATKR